MKRIVPMSSDFLLFLLTTVAIAAALQNPQTYVSDPDLSRGGKTEEVSHLRHGRILLTGSISYTLDAEFDQGSKINVNHDDVQDQLQLDSKSNPFNFIWVACSGRGTVVKVDTLSGKILGEYRSSPGNLAGNPSRTTVDKDGSVWLTNRNDVGPNGFGTVVHIGLIENNQCEDRNGELGIQTSTGLSDIKDWTDASGARLVGTAKDECIVHYTEVKSKGTRHVSVDADNNIWVSGSTLQSFDKIKGGKWDVPNSGTILNSYPSVGYGGYGGLMDPKGVIWSARPLLRWDTANPLIGANGDPGGANIGPPKEGTNWAGQRQYDSYGLCIDSHGNVWNTELASHIHKYASDGTLLGSYSHGSVYAQGCVVDQNDHVWVAHSLYRSTVGHLDNNGVHLGNVNVGDGPTGVARDGAGKVWATNYGSSTLSRIDPTQSVGAVDLTVELGTGCYPYNYGDMTGSTNIAPPNSGTWTVMYDNGSSLTDWGRIKWTAETPSDSSLTVQVRSLETDEWTPVTNGQKLSNLTGQRLYVQVSFLRASAASPSIGASPVLKDLSIVFNDCIDKAVGDVCNANTPQVGCCNKDQECIPLGSNAQCLCINDQPLFGNQDTGCESKLPNCDANDGKTGVSCFLCVNDKALGTKDVGCGDPVKPNCNATDGGKGTECFPSCKLSISKSFSGPNIGVEILVAPADGGGVLFKVREADANLLGDLRGVFFHVKDLSKKPTVLGNHVTSYKWGPSNSIVDLGNGANMQGDGGKHKFDVGVEIGNAGIGKDDIGETTFTIKGGNFGFADIDFTQEFGVRLTSVGPRSRDQSSKVFGYSGCANAAAGLNSHGSLRRLTG